MTPNEQQAQRDKLMELGMAWVQANYDCAYAAGEGNYRRSSKLGDVERDAEKAFRDYVEHMHDEVKE